MLLMQVKLPGRLGTGNPPQSKGIGAGDGSEDGTGLDGIEGEIEGVGRVWEGQGTAKGFGHEAEGQSSEKRELILQ